MGTANHSCEPNTEFDLSHSDPHKWHVRVVKPIARGEQSATCPVTRAADPV